MALIIHERNVYVGTPRRVARKFEQVLLRHSDAASELSTHAGIDLSEHELLFGGSSTEVLDTSTHQ